MNFFNKGVSGALDRFLDELEPAVDDPQALPDNEVKKKMTHAGLGTENDKVKSNIRHTSPALFSCS